MQDEALQRVIAEIEQQPQRQYAVADQLRILRVAANRLGLQDAADAIQSQMMAHPGDFREEGEL